VWRSNGLKPVKRFGVSRSPARAEELKQQGIEGVVADITRPQTLKVLPEAETVLLPWDMTPQAADRAGIIMSVDCRP